MNNNEHNQLNYNCATTIINGKNFRTKIYDVYYNNHVERKNIKLSRILCNISSDFLFNSSIYNVPTLPATQTLKRRIDYDKLMDMYKKIIKMYQFEEEIYTLFNELLEQGIYIFDGSNDSNNVMDDINDKTIIKYSDNYKEKYIKYKTKYLKLKSKLNY